MAETEIQKFDPSALMQGVRDRIKATFVSLIPDAQWEQLVQKEVDDFFKSRDGHWSSNRDWGKMNDFQKICFEEFEKCTREKVKETLAVYVSNQWEGNSPKVSDELKKLLVDNSAEIFTRVIGGMFQTALNNIQRN